MYELDICRPYLLGFGVVVGEMYDGLLSGARLSTGPRFGVLVLQADKILKLNKIKTRVNNFFINFFPKLSIEYGGFRSSTHPTLTTLTKLSIEYGGFR